MDFPPTTPAPTAFFGLPLVEGLSPVCLDAFNATTASLFTTCNLMALASTPMDGSTASAIAAILAPERLQDLCSPACMSAMTGVAASLGTACGDAPLFNGTTFTGAPINAAAIGSYSAFLSSIACVPTADGKSFCAAELAPPLIAASAAQDSAVLANATLICSDCTKRELALALNATSFVDYAAYKPTLDEFKNATLVMCATSPPPTIPPAIPPSAPAAPPAAAATAAAGSAAYPSITERAPLVAALTSSLAAAAIAFSILF